MYTKRHVHAMRRARTRRTFSAAWSVGAPDGDGVQRQRYFVHMLIVCGRKGGGEGGAGVSVGVVEEEGGEAKVGKEGWG